MQKDTYKLGKILATSAIVSDVPSGQPKPKRTKLKLVILAVILGYLGFAAFSKNAMAERIVIEGDAAEEIIVKGEQIAYWRSEFARREVHHYVIHRGSSVYECVHSDVNSESKGFVVVCVTNRDDD